MFGFGMVLASGCGSKTLVRIGGGNLKSLVVFAGARPGRLRDAARHHRGGCAWPRSTRVARRRCRSARTCRRCWHTPLGVRRAARWRWRWAACSAAGAGRLGRCARPDGRVANVLLGGLGIGAVDRRRVVGVGPLGHVAEHPQTLEEAFLATNSQRMESLSFVAPVAYTLDWLMFFSDTSKVLTIGIVSAARRRSSARPLVALADTQLSLGRFRRHRGHRQPPRRRGADGRRRRHRDGLHDRPGPVGRVDAGARQLHRAGRHRGRRAWLALRYQIWRLERSGMSAAATPPR